jgi:hypothetical protein
MAASAIPDPGASSPYQLILGEAFATLHANVQRAHLAPFAAEGTLDVEHGTQWLAPGIIKVIIKLMGLPLAGRGQPVRLEVTTIGADVEWTRRIGSSVLRTRQRAMGSRLVECNGIGRVAFELAVEDGALLYRQSSFSVAGIVLPPVVSPRARARVSPAASGWRVDVCITLGGRLLCRYGGVLGLV